MTTWPERLRFNRRALLAAGAGVAVSRRSARAASRSDTSIKRIARRRAKALSPGMSLPWWFWFSGPPWDPTMIDTGYSRENLERYFALGIRGVRLPLDYYLLTSPDDRSSLDEEMLAKIRAAIDLLLEIGYNVIADTHNAVETWESPDLSDRLEQDPAAARDFTRYWGALAARLSDYDPARLVIEVLNEPIFIDDPTAWTEHLLPVLVRAIRKAAPEHTILLSGPGWSGVDGVTAHRSDLIADANTIYNLHTYEPFTFTHQGADWVGDPYPELHDVPYPSSPERVGTLLDSQDWSESAREQITTYGDERWNRDKLVDYLAPAITWAKTNDVPFMVTEFGAYMAVSPIEDAARFVRDVRGILEHSNIPWMTWSDRGGFGFEREDGSFVPEMLTALGLNETV